MTSKYAGKFFQFSRKRLGFVNLERSDAQDNIFHGASNAGTKGAFIWDKKNSMNDQHNYEEFPVNETGAFILGFVLLKVPRDLIAELYVSEYGGSLEEAVQKIDALISKLLELGLLKDVTEEIKKKRAEAPPAPDPIISRSKKFLGFDIETKVGLNQSNHYKILYRI
jgi:hypothetical protein